MKITYENWQGEDYAIRDVELADGKVWGNLDFWLGDKPTVAIYGWTSGEKGKGHTNLALAELREQCEWISVHGIGENPEWDCWQYWQHQYDAGRVDELWDDEGNIVAKREE